MSEKETTPEAPAADRFDCVECGVGIASDEDGCCASCGRSVIIVRNHLPTYPASASEPPASTGERGALISKRARGLANASTATTVDDECAGERSPRAGTADAPRCERCGKEPFSMAHCGANHMMPAPPPRSSGTTASEEG